MDVQPASAKRIFKLVYAAGVATRAGLRTGPGLAGAGLVCYGLSLVYWPLLFIAAGGFLLLIDRQVP